MEDKNLGKMQIISKILYAVIIIAILVVVGISVYFIVDEKGVKSENSEYLKKIEEAMNILTEQYIDEIDMDKLVEGAIEGMTYAMDDVYTRYVDQEEYDEMVVGTTEKYTGLGMHINYDKVTGGIQINSIMENTPADRSELQEGDIIIKVNDLECNQETYYDCISQIKAEEPTTVHLVVLRDGETFEGDYTTEKVLASNVYSKVLDNNIGYIRIFAFDNGVASEFETAFKSLNSVNVEGLIIDLRNNPGGMLSEVLKIAKNILPDGQIVKLVYKDGTEKVYNNSANNKLTIPLIILVNENSASASEVLAGAVKDMQAGTLVGVKTYGKGIVQSIRDLKLSDGAISVTTSKYYTLSGIEIHKNGIEPNVVVEAKDGYTGKWYISYDDDLQLQKAVELISQLKSN